MAAKKLTEGMIDTLHASHRQGNLETTNCKAASTAQMWTVAVRDRDLPNHCLGGDIPLVGLIGGYDQATQLWPSATGFSIAA